MRTHTVALMVAAFFGTLQLCAEGNIIEDPAVPHAGKRSYGIHGSDLLWKQEAQLRNYLARHPEAKKASLSKQASWGFATGSQKEWYATDLVSKTDYLVPSTCRAVGTHCYIFVEDAIWGTRATQAVVDSVRAAFDLRTPAHASKGIYQTDVEAFGNVPNVDNDPRIIILILDIRDGFAGTGAYVTGYFYSMNEMEGPTSNEAEIYFLDANPLALSTPAGLEEGMSATAHELQHMIHWYYDPIEYTFVNEGCSLVAEVNAGYPLYSQSEFVHETNHYLFDWRDDDMTKVFTDYSRAARFMTYLRDQFGMSYFKWLVSSPLTDATGITSAMAKSGVAWTFAELVHNFAVANIVNDRTLDPKYGYLYPSITTVEATTIPSAVYITGQQPDEIAGYGSIYLAFKSGAALKAKFAAGPNVKVTAYEVGSSTKRIVDLATGVEFSEPLFGSTYKDIYFVITNGNDDRRMVSSTVLGKGIAVELRWDEMPPTGYAATLAGDSVCVLFEGVAGSRLDSIHVGLNKNGSVIGTIWSVDNIHTRPSFSTPLAASLTARIETDTPIPSPIPFSNWASVDLRSQHIDASNPFAVVLGMQDDPLTQSRVMVAQHRGLDPYYSWTYVHHPGSGQSANWYYYPTSGMDSVVIYLIRAYVSVNDATAVRPLGGHIPTAMSLGQNFPNPFNPSTTIQFSIAECERTRLIVYDMLGRESATLVNGVMQPGTYTVQFNAADLGSGVYFYRLQAGSFTQTKKLLLVR
jgi:hypothetical protein